MAMKMINLQSAEFKDTLKSIVKKWSYLGTFLATNFLLN